MSIIKARATKVVLIGAAIAASSVPASAFAMDLSDEACSTHFEDHTGARSLWQKACDWWYCGF